MQLNKTDRYEMSASHAVTGGTTADESHEYAACAFSCESLATVMKPTVKVVVRVTGVKVV
jgi:hypothetical protein